MPGYCTGCRRPRQVRVSGHGLALAAARRGTVEGVCSACEDYEDAARRFHPGRRVYDRHGRRHGRVSLGLSGAVERGAHEALVCVLFDDATESERVPAGRLEVS